MEYKSIEGRKVSRIFFGTWALGGWYWGGSDDEASLRAIRRALDLGVNGFDTAPIYGPEKSEELLGRALEGERDRVFLATKGGLRWTGTEGKYFFELERPSGEPPLAVYRNLRRDSLIRECEESLRRLKTDRIDLYQLHWPDPGVPLEEPVRALEELLRSGKILYAGVSNFTVRMMVDMKAVSPTIPLLFDQERYNLLERKIETNNIPYARKNKIHLLAYSPLAQGLLTGGLPPQHDFASGDLRSQREVMGEGWRKRIAEALERVEPLCQRLGLTPSSLALAWVLHNPSVSFAIAGMRSVSQVEENLRAAGVRLGDEDYRTATDAFSHLQYRGK